MNRDPRQILTEWLVLEAQKGGEAAFTDLHNLWSADLRRLVLVRVGRPESADEVLTEVWLAIARGIRGLDDPACFPRWAFRIVERRSTDWIRRRSVERRHELAAAAEVDALAPAPAPVPAPEASEDVLELREAIARLPGDQRQLLHLYYDLDRSVGEIAEILAVPPGTVKSRLFSVRETLRQHIEKKLS